MMANQSGNHNMRIIGVTHGDWDSRKGGFCTIYKVMGNEAGDREFSEVAIVNDRGLVAEVAETVAVSYTHLTLPTILLV